MKLRKKIVKLAKMIGGTAGIMNKIDENAPEYYCMAGCVSDDEADVALAMGLRKHRTIDEISKKCGKSKEEVEKLGDHLAWLGVCKYDIDEKGVKTYFINIFAPGVLEMMVGNHENADKHPEIYRAFNQYTHDRLAKLGPMLPPGMGLMRVIPIERALPKGEKADPRDTLSYYFDKYKTFSVADCSCRTSRSKMGEGCGHIGKDLCVQLGIAADFFVRSGKAKYITREELDKLEFECEENGLMHEMPNIEEGGETSALCNCCGCACFSLRAVQEFKTNQAFASNYRCEINKDNCVACGMCMENCPVNAIKLGEKLCTIKPYKIKFQKSLANHTIKASGRDPDYRFHRENVVEETGTAPCKVACPAHIAVQGYIKLASEHKYLEALELIKHENPFPAVCGRICPHNCENKCSRNNIDDPVAVDDIKKFIADKELDDKTQYIPRKRHDYSDKKIAIIGGGPAGLSCAYYLAQDGYDITVFEKEDKLGGMLTLGIPSFRLEKNVVEAEIDIIKKMGVKFKTGVEVGKDVSIADLRKEGFTGFYVAIGAQDSRKLGIPNEDNNDVIGGIDFLRKINLGEGQKLHGNVVVVGGGNVAMDVARAAIRQHADRVDLYCLEKRDEMPASKDEIAEAEEEGIFVHNGFGPKEAVEDEKGKLVGIKFKKCLSVFDDQHHFSPKYDEDSVVLADCSFALLAIGQSINYGHLLDGTKVEFNRNHTIKADELTYQTGEKDIFAGGDVYNGPSFAIKAIADGKQGAISLHRFVQPGQLLDAGRDRRLYKAIDQSNVDFSSFDKMPRQRPYTKPLDKLSYNDPRGNFTEDQIQKEVKRCLGCGCAVVDPNLCVGCGQCVIKCKFDAAHLVKKSSVYAHRYEDLVAHSAAYTVKRGIMIATNALKKDE